MSQLSMMADCLMEAVCDGGTDAAECGFCGKEYGTPVAEGQVPNETVGVGELAGTLVVHCCRCDGVMKYAQFVLAHRHALSGALRRFADMQRREAERLSRELC